MSLILDVIMIATEEIMRRRNIPAGKSFDIEKVEQACTNMKTSENEIVSSITRETKMIKEKIKSIQQLMARIYPASEFPMPFEDFMRSWHEFNLARFSEIKQRNAKIKSLFKQTETLEARALLMLQPKSYHQAQPPLSVIKDVAEFYENAGMADGTLPDPIQNDKLNLPWLIAQLHVVLPSIINYVASFKLDPDDSKNEELKHLKRLASELTEIETKTEKLTLKFKKEISEMVAKLKKASDERHRLEDENQSPEELAERTRNEQIEMEKLKVLSSPSHFFDGTKESLKVVAVKKNRLAFMDDHDTNESVANGTMLYGPVKSFINRTLKLNQSTIAEFAAPRLNTRRRRDPKELLERATSNVNALNSTQRYYTGAIPKGSRMLAPKFSSTMLSPDLHQPSFNLSIISSTAKFSPICEQILTPQHISTPELEKSFEKSFTDVFKMTLQVEENLPKVALNDDTLNLTPDSQVSDCATVVDLHANSTDAAFAKATESFSEWIINNEQSDEALINTSDTVLINFDD